LGDGIGGENRRDEAIAQAIHRQYDSGEKGQIAMAQQAKSINHDDYVVRLQKCRNCNPYFQAGYCKICGCLVNEKAADSEEICPIGKWKTARKN